MKGHVHHHSGEGGVPATICDPESELRKGGRWRNRARIMDGMEKKEAETHAYILVFTFWLKSVLLRIVVSGPTQ